MCIKHVLEMMIKMIDRYFLKDKYKMSLLFIKIGIVINVLNMLFMIITDDISYLNYFIITGIVLFIIGIIFFILFILEKKKNE